MKTPLLSLLAGLALAPLASGGTHVSRPSCCAELKSAAPLPAASVYQLGDLWTDDQGRRLTLAALRGRPVALAMIFTQCEYACPVMVNDLKRLREALPAGQREQLQLVLVSFDTRRDTPEALRTFRNRMELDAGWTLLTGSADAVQELAMVLGVKFKADARGQFAHSNLFTLLDAEGERMLQVNGLQADISTAAAKLSQVAPAR